MGYFQVRYDCRVVIYDRKMYIRLATDFQFYVFEFNHLVTHQNLAAIYAKNTHLLLKDKHRCLA